MLESLVWGESINSVLVYIQECVTIYHSERVETVFPGEQFHGDSVMHHMVSVAHVEPAAVLDFATT